MVEASGLDGCQIRRVPMVSRVPSGRVPSLFSRRLQRMSLAAEPGLQDRRIAED